MIKIEFDKENNKSVAYDGNTKIGECVFVEIETNSNIIHTEVSNLYQGQSIARRLVECVIENAKQYNKKVIADCFYAKRIVDKK